MCGGIKTLKHNVRTTLQPAYHQGRINHWANRANARGFALLGASHSHNQNTPLLVFHVFRLFTMRRNCRAFLLLCLLYTLRKLTWTKEHHTLLPKNWLEINASTGVRRNFSSGGQRRNFAYHFQVADNVMRMDVHKTLYLFYIPLVCAGWTSIHNLLSEMFSTIRLSEMLFLFINRLISAFFEQFLQISYNLRVINGQTNMSGEKTKNLTLSQNCFKQWQVERNVDKTIRQITKVTTPRRLKTLSR